MPVQGQGQRRAHARDGQRVSRRRGTTADGEGWAACKQVARYDGGRRWSSRHTPQCSSERPCSASVVVQPQHCAPTFVQEVHAHDAVAADVPASSGVEKTVPELKPAED